MDEEDGGTDGALAGSPVIPRVGAIPSSVRSRTTPEPAPAGGGFDETRTAGGRDALGRSDSGRGGSDTGAEGPTAGTLDAPLGRCDKGRGGSDTGAEGRTAGMLDVAAGRSDSGRGGSDTGAEDPGAATVGRCDNGFADADTEAEGRTEAALGAAFGRSDTSREDFGGSGVWSEPHSSSISAVDGGNEVGTIDVELRAELTASATPEGSGGSEGCRDWLLSSGSPLIIQDLLG